MAVDDLIRRTLDEHSYDSARSVRTVLSQLCQFAIRHKAMDHNPTTSTARLHRGPQQQKEVRALSLDQRMTLLDALAEHAKTKDKDERGRSLVKRSQVWHDLPDLVRGMLATGVRLGELMALTGRDVADDEDAVHVGYHIVRVTGQGLQRHKLRKGSGDALKLGVPEWSMGMWRRRAAAAGDGPLFPSARGGWLDPRNLNGRIREAFDACEFDWVTSHVFRKTVATVLDEAGLQTTEIADQLGNSTRVVEKHYRAPRQTNHRAVAALDAHMLAADESGD